MILRLDESVITQIRSHTIFHSLDLVVRELLQNSLDAGANEITIKIDLSSLSVYIHDNGTGITPDDLEKVTLQHYTSKWHSHNYKGEALFALKVISNLTIISKAPDYTTPFKLNNLVAELYNEYSGGYFQIGDINPQGTVVIAANMFRNIPVRREQIRTTPHAKLVEAIKVAVLESLTPNARVNLKIFLVNHTTLQLDQIVAICGHSPLLFQLFGVKTKFEPVRAKFKNIKVVGVIGREPITAKHQYVFVNDRRVTLSLGESKRLNDLFSSSGFNDIDFRTKTTGKPFYKHPTFMFRVYPGKLEVVQDSYTWNIVLRIIYKIIAKFLDRRQPPKPLLLTPLIHRTSDKYILTTKTKLGFLKENEIDGLVDNRPYHGKEAPLPRIPTIAHLPHQCTSTHTTPHLTSSQTDLAPEKFRVINQVDRKFILLAADDQLVVLDQHASDERIRVEQYLQEFVLQPNPGLRLHSPIAFDVHASELMLFDQYAANFNSFGICYYTTDTAQVVITHLPLILLTKVEDDAEFLKDSLLQHCYDLHDHVKRISPNFDNWFETSYHLPRIITELINSKACRSAIMFGDILTKDEMQDLVNKLSRCKLPFQCAHGRPSIVPISNLM